MICEKASDELLEKVWTGGRIGPEEARRLCRLPLQELGMLAHRRRQLAVNLQPSDSYEDRRGSADSTDDYCPAPGRSPLVRAAASTNDSDASGQRRRLGSADFPRLQKLVPWLGLLVANERGHRSRESTS